MVEERIPVMDLNLNDDILAPIVIKVGDKEVTVKQYLPMEEKINLIEKVMNESGEATFANPLKIEVFFNLALIENYTNLGIDADKPLETYDYLESHGIFTSIIKAIPVTEYNGLLSFLDESFKNFYAYKNSALGIMETISTDYSDLKLDAEEIQNKIGDKDNLTLLKDVVTKLG